MLRCTQPLRPERKRAVMCHNTLLNRTTPGELQHDKDDVRETRGCGRKRVERCRGAGGADPPQHGSMEDIVTSTVHITAMETIQGREAPFQDRLHGTSGLLCRMAHLVVAHVDVDGCREEVQ